MSFSGLAPVRDDFRCSLCRQKSVFHCEHDTPYRDRYLGAYEHEKQYMASANSQRGSHQAGSHNDNNHSTNYNEAQNTGRNKNATVNSQHQKGNKSDNHLVSNTNANGSSKTDEQKKKKGGCVIL